MNPSERAIAALQGSWEQIGLEADGVVDPPDAHSGPGVLCTFAERTFSVRARDGTLLLAGSFELEAMDHSITWIDSMGGDEGKRLPASYRLEADRFVFIAGNEGDARPTNFSTVLGQTMRTFVRHM